MKTLIDKHQTAIAIIEAIVYFEKLKVRYQISLDGFEGSLPHYRKRLIHRIEIIEMSINRIKERYERINFNI